MLLNLVIAPDKILRTLSTDVMINNNEDLRFMQRFLDDMIETTRHIKGLGLSAVQVGIHQRIFVIATEEEALHFINPKIVEVADDLVVMKEGCLSYPGIFVDIERPASCMVEFFDYNFDLKRLEVHGIVGRCVQHENDHLNGRLFVHYMGSVARDLVTRKAKKAKNKISRIREHQNFGNRRVN